MVNLFSIKLILAVKKDLYISLMFNQLELIVGELVANFSL